MNLGYEARSHMDEIEAEAGHYGQYCEITTGWRGLSVAAG